MKLLRTYSPEGIDLTQHFEGLGPHFDGKIALPYRCPAGVLTVGYGHVIQRGENFWKGITVQEARDLLLKHDMPRYASAVNNMVLVDLTQPQFDSLCDFAFNLGISALHDSTLLKLLNSGHTQQASQEFVKWSYAKVNGVKKQLKGLLLRRETEEHLFVTSQLVFSGEAQTIAVHDNVIAGHWNCHGEHDHMLAYEDYLVA